LIGHVRELLRSIKPSTLRQRFSELASFFAGDEVDAYGDPSAVNNLPPRTPTSRAPFGKEEAPEASRDPNDVSGNKPRRRFLKMRRTSYIKGAFQRRTKKWLKSGTKGLSRKFNVVSDIN